MCKKIDSMVNKSYYKPKYAKEYYQKKKEAIIKRSKDRWANMTDEEKELYYKRRKEQRKKSKENERNL